MGIITIIVIIAIVVGLIISSDFRTGAIKLVTDIVTIVFGVSKLYAIVVVVVAMMIFCLTVISLILGLPGLTGLSFLLVISLILLTWAPVGVITKIFGHGFVPKSLKTFIAWIAFVGFLGLVIPGELSFKVIIGAALVAFIILGVSAKINLLDKVIYPLVILMVAVLAWQNFFPESYRSTIRYAESWRKRIETSADRGSLSNEAQAATTYGVILKDVSVLYDLNPVSAEEREISLKAGQEVKVVSHRNEVTIYDGQGFIQIQLSKANGSFFKGEKYWIEAEFIEVVSPKEIIPERIAQSSDSTTSISTFTPSTVLRKGVHYFPMKAGEIADFHISSPRFCVGTDQGDMATLVYPNGSAINLWQASVLPNDMIFSLKSLVDQIVTIKVS